MIFPFLVSSQEVEFRVNLSGRWVSNREARGADMAGGLSNAQWHKQVHSEVHAVLAARCRRAAPAEGDTVWRGSGMAQRDRSQSEQ